MDLEHERRLTDVEATAANNRERIEKLESSTEAISRLATSMELMVSEQKHQTDAIGKIEQDVAKLDSKVETIEQKPAKRWDSLVEKIIWAVVGAVITFILAKVGL